MGQKSPGLLDHLIPKPTTILVWVRRSVIGLVGFVFLTLASQFLISYGDQQKWFANPNGTVSTVIGVIEAIFASPIFHWAGGIVVGLFLGLWADAALRRAIGREEAVAVAAGPTLDEIQNFAKRLEQLSAGIHRFVVECRNVVPVGRPAEPDERWEYDRQRDAQEQAIFQQRFGADTQQSFLTLDRWKVPIPHHIQHMSVSAFAATANYFGAIATMIGGGDLEAARSLTREQLWRLGL